MTGRQEARRVNRYPAWFKDTPHFVDDFRRCALNVLDDMTAYNRGETLWLNERRSMHWSR
jgi:hypothetical protein